VSLTVVYVSTVASLLSFAALLSVALAQNRTVLETYLASVYTSVPQSDWSSLSDTRAINSLKQHSLFDEPCDSLLVFLLFSLSSLFSLLSSLFSLSLSLCVLYEW
jgi:hypothetical protein